MNKAGAAPLAPQAAEQSERHLRLAESLGGSVKRLSGASIADALLLEAHRLRATRILVGKPSHQRHVVWFKENVVDRLVRHSRGIDVLVVCDDDEPRDRPPPPAASSTGQSLAGLGYVVGTLGATTVIGRLLWPHINDTIVSFVSLLIVLTSSLWFGRRTGVLAVVLAALVIDFFFVPPFFTLVIANTTDIVSLIVLLSVGLVVAELIVRLKAQTLMAVEREQRTARLLKFSRALAVALDADSIAETLAASTAAVTDAAAIDVRLTRRGEALQSVARLGPGLARFTASNRNPLMVSLLPPEALVRNALVDLGPGYTDAAPSGADSRVAAVAATNATAISHTGTHTSACGLTIFRGDLLGPEADGDAFTCEPVSHAVVRRRPVARGAGFWSGHPEPEGSEFVASSETWFRPVFTATAPDGSLWIVDFCRASVEHPDYMPPGVAATVDHRAGDKAGPRRHGVVLDPLRANTVK